MTDGTRQRFAIDLDEIERQLKQAQGTPAPRGGDPLAELARIVGQDDPFRAILAGERPVQGQDQTYSGADGLRGGLPGYDAEDAHSLRGSLPAYDAHAAHAMHAYAPPQAPVRDFGRLVDEAAAYQPEEPAYDPAIAGEEDYARPRSRKGLITVGAVLGIAVIGVAGALTFRGISGGHVGGEPPLIQADSSPLKVQPENPGGVEIPNQNKQIYQTGPDSQKTRVVNREEQPVDVRQAARAATANGTAPAAAVAPPRNVVQGVQSSQAALASALGEPRRVRTVSIRPDGTVIANDGSPRPAADSGQAAALAATQAAVPTTTVRSVPITRPAGEPGTTAATSPAPADGQLRSTSAAPARPVVEPPAAVRPRPEQVAAAPAPIQAPASVPPKPAMALAPTPAPVPAPAAVQPPKPQERVAAVAPPAPAPAPAAPAASASGAFTVQVGVANSEDEAQAAFRRIQQRYAEVLSGQSPQIQAAEVRGKALYRVRVGQMSREDAVGLCERLKSAGGECFVARN